MVFTIYIYVFIYLYIYIYVYLYIYLNLYIFIFIYIYIIIGEDKTTSSFMRQQFSCIYNIYVSKKTNKVDIYHNNTRQTKNQNQYYLYFIFANKNLSGWPALVKSPK